MRDYLQQNTNNMATKDQCISYCVRSTRGFTLIELLTIVAILG
ncbi:MAG: prepilin-type N-terminal cleavage/methylation domain-containing protein, partial [Deltaproteobacteria bacterium]|nr:prepilin-type N-terminal cleavage/methylation domain-containing protein [Deltaproteobacteria bacterium]